MAILDGSGTDGQGNTNTGGDGQQGDGGQGDGGQQGDGNQGDGGNQGATGSDGGNQGTDGGSQGGDGGGQGGDDGAPEKYNDFAIPKGVELDVEKVSELAKGFNLPQKGAQKLVDVVSSELEAMAKSNADAWNKTRDDWVSEIKTDKEFGGTNFNETVERSNRTLRKFGSEGLINYFRQTGLGDHPDLIKAFAKIDKALGDDKLIDGDNGDDLSNKSPAQIMYPYQGKT